MTELRSVTVVFPDGTEFRAPGSVGLGDYERLLNGGMVTMKFTAPWTKTRPSTAKLRRELADKSTSRARKMQIWNWLQYRRCN